MKFRAFWLVFAFVNAILAHDFMLLKTYNGSQNIDGWVMSEKYDGVRGLWDGKKLISRGNKMIHAPIFFTQNFPPFMIDGELILDKNSTKIGEILDTNNSSNFQNLCKIVADLHGKDEWKDVKFMIFDVPNAKGNLNQRLQILKDFLHQNPNKFIKIIEQKPVVSRTNLDAFLDEITKRGGEGVVVQDPLAPYIHTRSDKILKYKKTKDAECKVIAHHKGKGKFSKKFGALSCVDLKSGARFKIGSGFSEKERENPPKIGEIITYQYQNLTHEGKPRFAVFLRVRNFM